MMSNLFSIFDTNTNSYEMNWISSMMNLLFLPFSFWFFKPKYFFLLNLINMFLFNEFKNILGKKFNYLNSIFMISLFILIFLNNFLGLFPYIFTSSSHLIFSLSVSIPLWMNLLIFSSIKNTNFMFAHLTPQNTPYILTPLMVMIETISTIIRPWTLSIRLTANMIAGHLLLTLLSQSNNSLSLLYWLIIAIQIILLILEFSVSIIQSYVFSVLMTLYTKETN